MEDIGQLASDPAKLFAYLELQRNAKPEPLPSLFDRNGFRLATAVLANRFESPSGGFFACMAIHSAYNPTPQNLDRIGRAMNAVEAVYLPGEGVNTPDVVRYKDSAGGHLYAIAGTTNLTQWINYLIPANNRETAGVPGEVFSFFADVAEAGYAKIANDARFLPKGKAIVLVGHSLGGVLAELWASKLNRLEGFFNLGCTTYGAPRFGNPVYADTTTSAIDMERVVAKGDRVPNVLPSLFCNARVGTSTNTINPFNRYVHKRRRVMVWAEDTFGREYQEDAPVAQCLDDLSALSQGLGSLGGQHGLRRYARCAFFNSDISPNLTTGRLAKELFGV